MRFGNSNPPAGNGGISISGNGNQVTTGRVSGDVRNTYLAGGGTEDPRLLTARTRLKELTAALDAHPDEVSNIEGCRTALSQIDEQLRSPAPNGRRLIESLQFLNLAIGSAASVITSAEILKTAIEALTS